MWKDAFSYVAHYPRYLQGLWHLSKLKKPIVTMFGGKHVRQDEEYYHQAYYASECLLKQGMSVLTGGGPGIMEAALKAAKGLKNRSLGISVKGVDPEFCPVAGIKTIEMGNFAVRKKLLISYSCGFIIFPGGLGTLNEMTEVLNLFKADKLKEVPLILIGSSYWASITRWIDQAIKLRYILPEAGKLYTITDDIDFAVTHIVDIQ